ncbi:hypothetical protein BCY86_03355 [Pajaroellobacter abortibovis]|uniref:Uncharacterized protein n=1 Tax=Pajaroellobacter abortibovis TaxID=1882918 RepID=A0A1L6MW99_9BACT|nr:hypothetical protein BCY86_03355 [Pajaroellobacter abortibovis]
MTCQAKCKKRFCWLRPIQKIHFIPLAIKPDDVFKGSPSRSFPVRNCFPYRSVETPEAVNTFIRKSEEFLFLFIENSTLAT